MWNALEFTWGLWANPMECIGIHMEPIENPLDGEAIGSSQDQWSWLAQLRQCLRHEFQYALPLTEHYDLSPFLLLSDLP